MPRDSKAAVDEAPSVLLAFIHDEPTLPERLVVSEIEKQNHTKRLEKLEKEISKLIDAVGPKATAHGSQPQARV